MSRYENIVQIRCLLEGVGVEEMLADWGRLLPVHMEKWGLDRAEVGFLSVYSCIRSQKTLYFTVSPLPTQLVELFGSTRDQWMAADLDGWLAPNRIYPGVADAMTALMTYHEVYIVTTKQARFTETILRQMAGIPFPADRIFSQTVSGRPKSEVLEGLEAAHPEAASYHFVEDKMSTLEKVRRMKGGGGDSDRWSHPLPLVNCPTQVAKMDALKHWNLYLVDWGYNTAAERARAKANPRIDVVSISDFEALAGRKN